jgi:hypothetical protein
MNVRSAPPGCTIAAILLLGALLGGMGGQVAVAAPLVRDLGQGLLYYRVHRLPDDLPSPTPSPHRGPCVLDLRFVDGDREAGAALAAWIGFNASPSSPVFVLINGGTGAALRRAVGRRDPGGRLILAPAAAECHPDIAVDISPAADRAAYEALERGTALETLLTDNPAKPRMDEAELAREHLPDSALAEAAPEAKAASTAAPSPIDRVLQRAVQIDRGLIALKQLP